MCLQCPLNCLPSDRCMLLWSMALHLLYGSLTLASCLHFLGGPLLTFHTASAMPKESVSLLDSSGSNRRPCFNHVVNSALYKLLPSRKETKGIVVNHIQGWPRWQLYQLHIAHVLFPINMWSVKQVIIWRWWACFPANGIYHDLLPTIMVL